jgi:uncharacterized protein (DUF885 family)
MIRFLHLGLHAATACALLACGAASPPPPPKSASSGVPGDRLTHLVEQYWGDYQSLNPPRLPHGPQMRYEPAAGWDISEQFLADSLALERRYLEAVLALPRPSLAGEPQLTYDLFRRQRESAIESFTYPRELLPVNPFRSMPLQFAETGAGVDPYAILSAKDYDNWQARADDYARWTLEAIANMREGMRRGYTLPRILAAETLPVLAALGADTPANVFYQALHSIPGTLADSERKRLSDGITAGVRDKILPAYRMLHDFLRDEYLPHARQSIGLSALPLGQSWYAFLIKQETDSRSTPAEIHGQGLAEAERLRARLQTMLAGAGFAGNAQAFFEAMLRDPRLTSKTPDEVLNYYDQLKVEVAAAMPTLFAHPPQADFAIRRLDAFREATAPALSYQAPNRNAAAVLYVNFAGAGAQPMMPQAALFLREALPGHHYQLAIQEERSDLPSFRRFGGEPAFVEGWGLYAESLGEELGLYHDTEAKFAALASQLQCAAGLVIDTGLHSLGWTREQALDYLRAQVPMDEAAARNAVDRSLALPGEALACGAGLHRIQSLRARTEQVLGTRFDVRAFHSELLDDGAMPLDMLEAKVNVWLSGLR